ncbi:MAG: PucR family transcriptional regulator [Nocardioides sp.]|uniref:PucR family transcriptional regulator n=1 Tax=Nocardioides sp. TaxID=35761 RepID=UPI003D6BF68E
MTSAEHPLRVGDGLLYEDLLASRADLVTTVLSKLRSALPVYDALPEEILRGEVAPLIAEAIDLFAETIRHGRLPDAERFAPLETSAGRRAEDGIPLQDVLTAYHLGCIAARDHVTARAARSDFADLNTVDRLLFDFLARTSTAVSTGYLRMSRDTAQEAQVSKRALLDALLEGSPTQSLVARTDITLPDRYSILSLSFSAHPDESQAGSDPAVVTTLMLRRMRHDLEAISPHSLSVMTPKTATILLPQPSQGFSREQMSAVVDQLQRAAGTSVLAAEVGATPATVPSASELAREVLALARRTGRTEGLVRLDDVLVEFQLSRESAATAPLAAILSPLAGFPDLLATLRTFLLHQDLNRRRVAAALQVHPNTVDYRLKRVAVLTGLDAAVPAHAQRLMAALAALELVEDAPIGD